MEKFIGKGIYPALAVGKIKMLSRHKYVIKRIVIDDTDTEIKRLEAAKEKATIQLSRIYEKALKEMGEENARVFEIHIMMIDDEDYNESIREMILTQKINAEFAVSMTGENFAQMFSEMDDSYMQARAADVKDISARIINCLLGAQDSIDDIDEKVILCADDIMPSEIAMFEKDRISAFVTAYGAASSHTAILARNLAIPAIIGVGKEFLSKIKDGDIAIADSTTGEFTINPDSDALIKAEEKQAEQKKRKELLAALKGKKNITLDGKEIDIFANIGSADETDYVIENDAGGIGLFRSEFIYLESTSFPTEEQQFAIYKSVLQKMGDKKVIIRTLDIGADKTKEYFGLKKEENPVLGMRAIRVSLTRKDIFITQLRALYRASVYGKLAIMFPLIISANEVAQINEICEEVKQSLRNENIPFDESVQTGIMIETPAAAVISDILAPMVDFFSIGTNDLTQYVLACDRQNSDVEPFCDTHHTAILRLINHCAENAHKYGKWIGICGELAADLSLTEDFIKIGIDELSVSSSSVLALREKVRSLRIDNGGLAETH